MQHGKHLLYSAVFLSSSFVFGKFENEIKGLFSLFLIDFSLI